MSWKKLIAQIYDANFLFFSHLPFLFLEDVYWCCLSLLPQLICDFHEKVIKRYIDSKSNGPWNSTIAAHQLQPADIFKHFFIPHSTICEYYVNILDKLVQHFTWNWYPRIIAYPGCSPLDTCFNIFLKLIQQSMNTDSTFQYIDLTFMGL